jgi:hypothetical protein
MVILLVAIIGYSIGGFGCSFINGYLWLLIVILLMIINDY